VDKPPIANWKTQTYGRVQSLLFNNPRRVIRYLVADGKGGLQERSQRPAPVRRLYETEAPPERTCLQTVQFVHHMILPPGERHVEELHIHPDAEELVVILRGQGVFVLAGQPHEVQAEDVIYIPPGQEHELRNTGSEMLFCLFINIPVGEGLRRLQEAMDEVPGKLSRARNASDH
jgi:mannose-6-phosphate isomerase-like protein (cupin superfamily)